MSNLYKVQFELVNILGKGGQFYQNEKPMVPPEFVPDEFWTETSRETDSPWQQYNQLKEWAASGEHLIRNVQLFKLASAPTWIPYDESNVKVHTPLPATASDETGVKP